MAMLMAPSGPALATGECSVFPIAKAGPASPASAIACAAPAVFSFAATRGFSSPYIESVAHSSYNRAGQKRGPPLTIA